MKEDNVAGFKKDDGKQRWDLIPNGVLAECVKVFTQSTEEYPPNNWQILPDAKNRIYAAIQRHFQEEWWDKGITEDHDSGLHPLAHAICGMMFLLWYEQNGYPEDENPKHGSTIFIEGGLWSPHISKKFNDILEKYRTGGGIDGYTRGKTENNNKKDFKKGDYLAFPACLSWIRETRNPRLRLLCPDCDHLGHGWEEGWVIFGDRSKGPKEVRNSDASSSYSGNYDSKWPGV